MEAKPSLTIAIPTYNRPELLAETLRRLLPQISGDWVLHIHDNHGDQPVEELHVDLLAAFGSENAVVFRNQINIGGNANILRCFESCSTEWLVVFGDDDEIEENCVQTFLETIGKNPNITFANFSSNIFSRENDFVTKGISEFCQRMDDWSNLLFLPCGLYNAKRVSPYVRYGYQYIYTYSPHIALLLQCLRDSGGMCLFASQRVVTYRPPETVSWSRLNLNIMIFLLELIPDRSSQLAFFRKMKPYFMPAKRLTSNLIERACLNGESVGLIFEFRILCFRAMERRIRDSLLFPILRLLIRFPKISIIPFRISRALRGLKTSKDVDMNLHQNL